MKFIGQYIQSFIARFRNDVYLEDISTGTIASGSHLGLDSNNKIVKAVDGGGDLTSIVAGTGLSGTSLTGPIPTLNLAITTLSTVTPTSGDSFATLDASTPTHQKTTTDSLATLFAGGGLTASSAVISVDASQPAITTLAGLTSLGAAGATTDIAAGDLTMYNAVNDGNPTISLGSSATNRFEIKTGYNSGAQTLDEVYFNSYTTSGDTNDGRYIFQVDEVELLRVLDSGIVSNGSGSFKTGLTDTNETASSATEGGRLRLQAGDGAAMADNHRLGVIEFRGDEDASATKSVGARIQAICRDAWDGSNNDADLEFYTTNGTTESKVLTLDADKLATFTGAVTVTGALSGTLATASQTNITGVGTIDSGVWQGTAIATAYIAGDAINGDKIADDAVDSEHYTDGSIDTAHIADAQITVAKLHADAIQTSGEAFADNDTSLMTSASINDRINRPDKQIVLMRAAFKDDVGTDKHYVPLQSESEQTLYYHEINSFVAPYAGKLLKVMYRSSSNLSGGDVTFTLEQIDRNETFLTTPDVLETITVTGPTNNTTDPNMVTANFVGGSGTNAFVAGDQIMLGMQFDTDVTGSSSRHFFTLVFEFDFSGVAQ